MARTSDHTAERDAIRAAMHRLLTGQPVNSTGALTVLQLAAEAGVKRWVLTHKHPDLRKEFEEQRDKVNGIPQAYQHLQARVVDLEADNKRLRNEKKKLAERVEVYAQVIHELAVANERLRATTSDNVRAFAAQLRSSGDSHEPQRYGPVCQRAEAPGCKRPTQVLVTDGLGVYQFQDIRQHDDK